MTVKNLRKELHATVNDMEEISMGDIYRVNTFSRRELMKTNTRELTALVCSFINPAQHVEFARHLEEYDHLAIDWVSSNTLDWDGSMVDKQSNKIIEKLRKNSVDIIS